MTIAAVAVLFLAHSFARRLAFVHAKPRHWALSTLGGVSLAYVFLHLIPETAAADRHLHVGGTAIRHAGYALALLGALVFFAVEHHSARARRAAAPPVDNDSATTPGAFWLSMAAFSLYNAFIGVLVHHTAERDGAAALAVLTVALALHFVVNDVALREHHAERYDAIGRWLLATAIVAGWLFARTVGVTPTAFAVGVAMLGGGITLNVLKEELPAGRSGHVAALAPAAAAFGVVLLLVA